MLYQSLKTSISSTRGLYFINLFTFKNHSLSLCTSNANFFRYLRSPIEPTSNFRNDMLSACSCYHFMPFLGTPCLNFARLSQPMDVLAGFKVNVRPFCSEIVLVGQSLDFDEAAELFEFMRTKGSTLSSPTTKTYAIMIVALVQHDRMEECFKLLGHMINSGCLPDVSTCKELLEGMCLAGKMEEAYKFLQEMGNKGYPPDIVTYNCFLKVLCDNKKSDEALRVYGRTIDGGCMPSVQTYNMLISMYFEMSDPDGAFETWHEMDKRGCAQDTDIYCMMIEGLFDCSQVEDACRLLEDVVNKEMKLPYSKCDSFLMKLSMVGDLQSIHRLSSHMRKLYNPVYGKTFCIEPETEEHEFERVLMKFVPISLMF